MPDTVIQALREFMLGCPYLDEMTHGIHQDWMHQDDPTDYGLYTGGDVITSTDMCGAQIHQLTFHIQSARYFADSDENMTANSDFLENTQNWISGHQRSGLPLPDGCDFIDISAGNGMPIDLDESGTAYLYRITGNLTYEKEI